MSNQVITFGCRLNAYESEGIKEVLKKTAQKNLIIFNSCAVTSEAERQLCQAVRKARKNNPEAKIVITGCAAQIDPQKYAKMEEVDLVVGNVEKTRAESYDFSDKWSVVSGKSNNLTTYYLPTTNNEIVHKDRIFSEAKKSSQIFLNEFETAKIKVNDIMSVSDTAPQLISYFENKTRAFLEIQNGCNHRCTFCVIPFGRGNSRSVSFGEIVLQAKKMVAAGHHEIVLTGVDISSYGEDLAIKITLSQMIKRLLKLVPELPRLRLSSIDVAEIDEEFFDILKNEPRFMPYLHLSVQSGDDIILKRMKRRHNCVQVLEFCKKARQIRSDMTFGADIIAGFPTETDEMFENSVKLIKQAGIIFTHIFPYSKRDGTPAAKMPQINGKIVKERARILREAGQAELQKFLKKQVEKTFKVLVEKDGIGKAENFLDVKISGEIKNLKSGDILKIKALGVEGNFMIGSPLSQGWQGSKSGKNL
ncbi:MAG: tRNA (N(6)-L-threonylcarbamoyladenosine(37)-C(2))-methylthiotransferase MtaB [Alphaproteobacteria bacterium RIFCSPLOWO2_01_FULL_40_26]|nr:MAG: tRNA (N(6)-L-threonylcarbamoyladenosine(37)-C(2))-methylthiotransferase MtaB [Alphaproteobacteria bacterium RIFCSPHIGHO2_02_FULL_40_34]OFW94218.1 MAG: tRNA (N(6)-L-threonylcarbamoyladenosine(37)-C(2))-methylthiotransferase MtaB [Alphaproteobacteria bacterium RIFCSPLOWO2_01_FULL_40_26]OFX09787.1 MAG: tRNA (N(6)-L-threonylcarbamoyladenosine(37)-C(2))-methylthiotransferase MtaB [Alphaproteobacteria bacterium RIFCSPLOWO2_02_FULL_40_19]OFX12272.1 MAG: tRNA (N(6)-L-threonylcarbamoyladenosine(3